MVNKILKFRYLLKLFVFIPLIFYFGKRSYIAFDEGYYALQARWILEKGNWIIPLWWDEYVLDRTIGLQFLIAKSQEIFGRNMFAAYLPTITAAILMLFITYKFHEEFFNKKYAIISPLILSTTYLWFDYSHLATQDIVYSSLVTIGLFSLVKIKNKDNKLYILFFGIWIEKELLQRPHYMPARQSSQRVPLTYEKWVCRSWLPHTLPHSVRTGFPRTPSPTGNTS